MSEFHHHHSPQDFGSAFAIGIALNLGFVLLEAFYGWRADSLALLADAGHNLSDVVGLILAWAGIAAARLRPDERHTYGWRRASIMAGFANAVLLLLAMGSLAWEAVQRLQQPAAMAGYTVMAVAGAGVVINTFTAVLLVSGSRHDLNIRGAFLHMAADALVSVGVVLAGAMYLWQGWAWIDPVMALLIAAVIVVGDLVAVPPDTASDVRRRAGAYRTRRGARLPAATPGRGRRARSACLGDGQLGDGAHRSPRSRRRDQRHRCAVAARDGAAACGFRYKPRHAADRDAAIFRCLRHCHERLCRVAMACEHCGNIWKWTYNMAHDSMKMVYSSLRYDV